MLANYCFVLSGPQLKLIQKESHINILLQLNDKEQIGLKLPWQTPGFKVKRSVIPNCLLQHKFYVHIYSLQCQRPSKWASQQRSHENWPLQVMRISPVGDVLERKRHYVSCSSRKAGKQKCIFEDLGITCIAFWIGLRVTDLEAGETVETVSDFIFWGTPKSLQMVTAAMKLKDAYSLEEKVWPT